MAEVSVRKKRGKWEYRFDIASVDGKRKQKTKSGFKTKAEALKAGREALDLYEHAGQTITPLEISVADLMSKWMEEYVMRQLKQSTYEGYEKKIRLYINPAIGAYKATSVTRMLLQELINDLCDQGFSKNSVSSIRGIITNCFDWAEMNRLIPMSPAYRLRMPINTSAPVNSRTKQHIYIEPDQVKMIFNRFPEGSTGYLPMQIAYHTGLRLSEVYALVWEDIDFEKKTLSVNRQVDWLPDKNRSSEEKKESNGRKDKGNGYWYFTTPKYRSFRTIEIDDQLLAMLHKEYQQQQKAAAYYDERYYHYYATETLSFSDSNHEKDPQMNPIGEVPTPHEIHFVLRRESGEYTSSRTHQHVAMTVHNKLNIAGYDFHSWRHTHATDLAEQNVPKPYIQARLGHIDDSVTERVYTNHVTEAAKEAGLSGIRKIFS